MRTSGKRSLCGSRLTPGTELSSWEHHGKKPGKPAGQRRSPIDGRPPTMASARSMRV